MKTTIKIDDRSSKNGYFLLLDGYAIGINCEAINSEFGIPYGAVCFGSIKGLREFWNSHRELICHNYQSRRFASVWGELVPETNNKG